MNNIKSKLLDFDGECCIPWPEDYDISFQCGFLIQEPKKELSKYFKPWIEISTNLHRHLEQHTLRKEVNKMPLLDHRQLEGREERILAYVILTFISHGYVWQDRPHNVAKVLPRQLAVPLFEVSNFLQLAPVLTYFSTVLANCKLTDLKGSREIITGFHPWDCMSWFVKVAVNMELTFAKALTPILLILDSVRRKEHQQLVISLQNLTEMIIQMKDDLSLLHKKVNARDFFQNIRPFFDGWGIENGPMPDGLTYEGVSEEPKCYMGGSGAQSGIFQTLDVVLGIQHDRDKEHFLEQMKTYMLPNHQAFIDALKMGPDLKQYVRNCSCLEVKRAYNKAVIALREFRTCHIGITCKYIIQQKVKLNEISKEQILVCKADGGEIMPFLKMVRDDTQRNVIEEEINEN